ncbi:MAG: hypothetical protein JWO73_675 [Candidatus Taylorbacteria bacterium]|nr:hypothetical protein [Candidatus Taylorbacteria bacterium]
MLCQVAGTSSCYNALKIYHFMKNSKRTFVVLTLIIIVIAVSIYFIFENRSPHAVAVAPEQVAATSSAAVPPTSASAGTISTVHSTTSVSVAATPKKAAPVPAAAPAAQAPKNSYSNAAAGYSLDLPSNWVANLDSSFSDPAEPQATHVYFSAKGKTVDEQGFTFDVQTATTKHFVDSYKQQFGKTPTNEDLFNFFMATQKAEEDQLDVKGVKKVVINGNEAYEVSALFSGGGGTVRFYVFYTPNNTYLFEIQGLTDTWAAHESELLGVVGSFKIK